MVFWEIRNDFRLAFFFSWKCPKIENSFLISGQFINFSVQIIKSLFSQRYLKKIEHWSYMDIFNSSSSCLALLFRISSEIEHGRCSIPTWRIPAFYGSALSVRTIARERTVDIFMKVCIEQIRQWRLAKARLGKREPRTRQGPSSESTHVHAYAWWNGSI